MAQASGSNNINLGNDLRVVYAAGATAGATNNVFLLPGVGSAAAKTLGTGITISGDYTSMADLADYVNNVPCLLQTLRIETSNTANFENTAIVIGERNPNNQNNKERRFYLADFQESVGNGLKKSIKITKEDLNNGEGLIISPQTYIKFEGLVQSTTITAYFNISHVVRTFLLDAASF
jgi:hypothetical protein